jgi:hypothetical protein
MVQLLPENPLSTPACPFDPSLTQKVIEHVGTVPYLRIDLGRGPTVFWVHLVVLNILVPTVSSLRSR